MLYSPAICSSCLCDLRSLLPLGRMVSVGRFQGKMIHLQEAREALSGVNSPAEQDPPPDSQLTVLNQMDSVNGETKAEGGTVVVEDVEIASAGSPLPDLKVP
ncbi:unnamed protein product [Linum tenue]|uniref:Uncharacterized protein n=1 Tax=Linum tenue TaxID=586396 RepID=A0AAV0K154_9ROSI|nr:unnamed protein product [Linum tenue]